MAHEIQQTVVPKEDEQMSFQKHYKKLECPFVLYCDFECLTTPSTEGIKGTYVNESEPKCPQGTYVNESNLSVRRGLA